MNDLSNCFFAPICGTACPPCAKRCTYAAKRRGQGRGAIGRGQGRGGRYTQAAPDARQGEAPAVREAANVCRDTAGAHTAGADSPRDRDAAVCGLSKKNRPRAGERNQAKVTADFQPPAPRRAPKNRRRRTLSAGTARAERPCRRSPARRTSRRQAASRSPRRARRKSARIPRK